MRLLARPSVDARPARLPDDDPVPGLRARLDDRSGDAVRRGAAGHEPPDDGYLLVQPGGPHVIFGRGDACPDDTVTAFLLDGVLPGTRFVTCDFTGTDPYVPIPAATVADYRDALAAMTAMDDEINTSADYRYWDGVDPLAYGCLFGGSIEYTRHRNGYKAALDDCEFTDGLPLTGTRRSTRRAARSR